MPNPTSNRTALTGLVLLTLLMTTIAAVRAWIVNGAYGPVVGCDTCFIVPVLAHDLSLLALVLAWAALTLWLPSRLLRLLFALPLLLLLLLLVTDVAVLDLLAQRLMLGDLLKFGHEIGAVGKISRVGFSGRDIGLGIGMVGLIGWGTLMLMRAPRLTHRRLAITVFVAFVCAGLAAWGRGQAPGYVHADAYRNWIDVNLSQSIDTPYSAEFLVEQQRVPQPAPVCMPGQQRPLSIIVVLVESLSTYHSAHYVATESYIPKLDALVAREGSWFTDFIANGFTTDGGMIAALAGRTPTPGFFRYASTDAFTGFEDPNGGFVDAVAAQGYDTLFFTTGTLGFVDKEGWLPKMRFRHFEGAEAPFYDGMPRGVFQAADDPQLFARVLDWYRRERDPARPFAASVLTVATHPPFLVRATGARDEHAVFAELDEALVDFHAQLAQTGFFEHGLLLVMGDHRSMTPLHPEEYRRYGEAAFAHTPMFAFGAHLLPRGEIRGLAQQTDLPASMRDLVGSNVCRSPEQGLFLRPDPVPAQFALHARGMPRNQIDVYRADGHYALQLAGDDSAWIGSAPPEADTIAARIHLDRGARAPNRGDLMQRLIELNAERAYQSIKASESAGQ